MVKQIPPARTLLPGNIDLHLPGESVALYLEQQEPGTTVRSNITLRTVGDLESFFTTPWSGGRYLLIHKSDLQTPAAERSLRSATLTFLEDSIRMLLEQTKREIAKNTSIARTRTGAVEANAKREIAKLTMLKSELTTLKTSKQRVVTQALQELKTASSSEVSSPYDRSAIESQITEVFQGLPAWVREGCEAIRPSVVISPLYKEGGAANLGLSFSATNIAIHSEHITNREVWNEEIIHCLDRALSPRFTDQPAWEKEVVNRYCGTSTTLLEFLDHARNSLYVSPVTLAERWNVETDPVKKKKIEVSLCREVLPYLSEKEEEERKFENDDASVSKEMRRSFGNLWLMYHGPDKGMKLLTRGDAKENAELREVPAAEAGLLEKEGWHEFESFRARCARLAQERAGHASGTGSTKAVGRQGGGVAR